MSAEIKFAWACGDCLEKGVITVRFPLHPDHLSEAVWSEHHKAEKRRHCQCPGHYLDIVPVDETNALEFMFREAVALNPKGEPHYRKVCRLA